MSLRVALVGTGSVARLHAEALARADLPASLVAAVDRDRGQLDAFCDTHGVPSRSTSLEEVLLAERPDVVHLCTPPGGHAEQAVTCLEAGAHVVCEKPPVLSLAELDEVAASAARTGRHFVPLYQHRAASSLGHVRSLLDAGSFGRPLVATCHTLWHRDADYYAAPWRRGWTAGGGPTATMAVHQLDLLLHLLGDWTQVSALADRLDRDVETEDVSMAHVRFAGGAVASVVTSVLSPRQESALRLDCERATVELSHLYGYGDQHWRLTPAPHVGELETAAWAMPEPDVPSSHDAFLREVYADLVSGRRPAAAGPAGRAALELATAVYASALAGRPLRREELEPGHPSYAGLPGRPAAGVEAGWARPGPPVG